MKFGKKELEHIFKENFKALCGYCQVKFNFDIDLSKEMVQGAFIKLWERRDSISPELSPMAYLYKIVTNNCLDLVRHEKRKSKYENDIQKIPASQLFTHDCNPAVVEELRKTIDRSVADMPEQMRNIFKLSRYEGLKYSQIAGLLGISVKTVETQMSRALSKLKQALADYLLFLLLLIFIHKNIF